MGRQQRSHSFVAHVAPIVYTSYSIGYRLTVPVFLPVKQAEGALARFPLVIKHFYFCQGWIVLFAAEGHRGCTSLSLEETLRQGTLDHDVHASDHNSPDNPRYRLCVIPNLEYLMTLISPLSRSKHAFLTCLKANACPFKRREPSHDHALTINHPICRLHYSRSRLVFRNGRHNEDRTIRWHVQWTSPARRSPRDR